MELLLRAALIAWLKQDAGLAGMLSCISEEAPGRPTLPWLSIASSAAIDWSTKTESGAEVRVAVQVQARGDQPGDAAALVRAVHTAVVAMPAAQAGFRVVSARFAKSRSEQRGPTVRAVLMEYRFRVMAA